MLTPFRKRNKGDVEEQESGERRGDLLSGCVSCTRLQRPALFGDRDPQLFSAALRSKPKALTTPFRVAAPSWIEARASRN